MFSLLKKIFGSSNDRLLKQLRRHVAQINALEPQMQALSDEQLQAKTGAFKDRLVAGETLDQLLPEAFAVFKRDPRYRACVCARTYGSKYLCMYE